MLDTCDCQLLSFWDLSGQNFIVYKDYSITKEQWPSYPEGVCKWIWSYQQVSIFSVILQGIIQISKHLNKAFIVAKEQIVWDYWRREKQWRCTSCTK